MYGQPEPPLRSVLQQCRAALPTLFIFSFFINLLILTSPLYMMQTFDRVLASGRVETLLFLTLLAAVAVLVMGLLETARARILARVGCWFERRLAPELISSGVRGASRGGGGGAQPLRDLATIRGTLTAPSINAVFDAPWVPIFIAVIWLLHPWLGMVALAAAIVLLCTALINEYMSRKPLGQASRLGISAIHRAGAAIRNADVFQAMGMLPGFLEEWTRHHRRALSLQLTASDRIAVLLGFSKFFRLFVQIAVLGAGAYLVLQAELTPGGMIAASILLGRALAPVEHAIGSWRGLAVARQAYRRLKSLLERLPPERQRTPLPPPRGRLLCEDLFFVPPGRDQLVLQGLSFSVEPGEALGVIGPSAAGKSTLCKIVVGTWPPTRGRAKLDGADLFDWPADQLGRFIGYLPQDIELFDGTVRENIARLDENSEAEAVVEAAKTAGVHETILGLPDGYETEVGEGGAYLSGGQRQRIGLARALYGRPHLIVLDEPNANLDSEGEQALVAAIRSAKEWGAIVVLVTHQPRILGPVDKLLILRDGRMDSFAPRDQVLAKLYPLRVAEDGQRRPAVAKPGTGQQPAEALQTLASEEGRS